MSFEIWLAFAAASSLLLVIPGPTVLLVLSYALGRGWKAALPMAGGVAAGDLTAMTLSMLGVGALLATSATLFTALKWVGALYLIWLGIKLWRSGDRREAEPRADAASPMRMFGHAWLVTTLNPKSILFFVAFVPQFLDPSRSFAAQAVVMIATFVGLGFINALAFAFVGVRARDFVQSPRAMRFVNRTGVAALIGAGATTAAFGRAA